MKIGIVTYALYIGGVEVAIKTLYDYFKQKGYSVDIIQTLSNGSEAKNFIKEGYSVKTILIKPFESQNAYAKRLAKELNKYDVLLLNNVRFIHYLLGILKPNITVLPILHNNSLESYQTILINQNQYNKIICVSHTLEKSIKSKNQIPNSKIVTIPTGVEVPKTFPKSKNPLSKPFTILFVGRIEEESKGVMLLPKIIKKVVSNTNEKIVLKIIGKGVDENRLKRVVKQEKLNNYIEFLGALNQKEVLNQMRRADILLMPSYHEGQGLVYLEAMAQGLIPLVSKLKDNTDLIITDGKNGFLCEIRDIDCFANKILYLLNNKEQIIPISKEAWQSAYNKLSSDIMAQKYFDLIDSLKNSITNRTNKLKKIKYGNLPYFIYYCIHFIIRVKNKIKRVLNKD